MSFQYTSYALLPLASAAVLAALSFFAFRRRATPGATPFALLMLAGCQWKLAYALEMGAADLPAKVLWAKVGYLGLAALPLAWLAFALNYTGSGKRLLTPRNLALLSLVPLLTVGLTWTNGAHGLVWDSTRLDASGPFPAIEVDGGAWFWVNAAYSYLLVLAGTVLLARGFVRSSRVYRKRGAALLAGALVTWGGNALYIAGLSPLAHLNPSAVTFPVTGALFAWALFRLRLLDVLPVARDAVVEGMDDGVVVLDDRDVVVDLNPAASRILGGRASEVVGRGASRIAPLGEAILAHDGPAGAGAGEMSMGEGADRRDYEVALSPFGTGRPAAGRLVVLRDVTARKRAEEALRLRDQAIAESGEGILITDPARPENPVVYANRGFERITGYPVDEMVGRSCRVLQGPARDQPGLRGLRSAVGEGREWSGVLRNYRRDGTPFWNRLSVSPVRDDEGRLTAFVGVMNDVTERQRLEQRLERQAFHDHLTGLPNRALFLDRAGHALARAARRGGEVAVLFLDLDEFKVVNDSLGHEAGDRLLVSVAGRLRACLRPGDTVARLGGDEFVVLLEDDGRGEAPRVAGRIAGGLRRSFVLEGHEVSVTASIGVAFGDPARGDPGDLLREADLAMYRAKERGKARHEVFEEAMNARALERLRLEGDLRRAAADPAQEFAVHYQPKVSLETGEIVGTEALLRWEHPERGLLFPEEFVALAEETGLIVPLGRWVLEEACRKTRGWQTRRPGGRPLEVGVNLSARQFRHEGLIGEVAGILKDTGLEHGTLDLEITEGVAMGDAGTTVGRLGLLKGLGVKLSVDDFGTGYSSLSYLKRFPVDHLKIDGSFVAGLGDDPKDETIVSNMVDLARGLGLQATAEGVETGEQLRRLRAMGCDVAQGYLFSEPLPAEAAAELLAANPRRWS